MQRFTQTTGSLAVISSILHETVFQILKIHWNLFQLQNTYHFYYANKIQNTLNIMFKGFFIYI